MIPAIVNNLPVFVVILPLFIAFTLPTLSRRMRLVETMVVVVSLLGLLGSIFLAGALLGQDTTIKYALGGWSPPWGIELIINNFGGFFLLVVALVILPIALFSCNNLSAEVGSGGQRARFYVLFLLLSGSLAGMAVTNDLFNIFVLVEVATLSCCGLVSARNHPRAAEAAFRYLILATLGSAFVLAGIGLIYITTGHLNISFANAALAINQGHYSHVLWMAISFMIVGFGVKSALFPLHIWLPEAHSIAPTPASAILSGLAVKGYIVCLIKILYNVFGPAILTAYSIRRILALAGMLAIIAGSILALKQKALKRRLAYSTVAQVGYIFLGICLANDIGIAGALFYLASHAIIKAGLFLAAGAIIQVTGKDNIDELAGIGKTMPITMGAFTIASLGLVGIPLFSGFIGKWHLLLGATHGGNNLAAAVIILGSILCAAYLFPVLKIAYFSPGDKPAYRDPGLNQKLALIFLAMLIIIFGIFPDPLLELAKKASVELLLLQ